MRLVFSLVLVMGLGLAGFAVYMAKSYIDRYETALAKARAEQPETIPTVEVYVAARALKYGDRLTDEDVRAVKWPKESLPEGIFKVSDGGLIFEDPARERTVLRRMEANEAVLAVKITEPGQPAGLTTLLAPGMRAFAIKVDVASGVSGFLRPGNRVDVYWTGRGGGTADMPRGEITKLIETGVELVAVDQITDVGEMSGASIARTVTVAVRPQQVAKLAQAQSSGRLSLALVGVGDNSVAEAVEVDQLSLLGLEREVAPEPVIVEKEEVCTIRTRRGSEVVELPIPCTN